MGLVVETSRFPVNDQSLQQTWRAQRALVHKKTHKNWLLAVARKCNLLTFPFTPVARITPRAPRDRHAVIAPDAYFYTFLLYLRRTQCVRTVDANIKHETARPDYKLIIFNE